MDHEMAGAPIYAHLVECNHQWIVTGIDPTAG